MDIILYIYLYNIRDLSSNNIEGTIPYSYKSLDSLENLYVPMNINIKDLFLTYLF